MEIVHHILAKRFWLFIAIASMQVLLYSIRVLVLCHISINEREELYEALDENVITVITYLRDEANKHSQTKLSPLNIHLILLLAMGYSTGVIRECLAVSTDNTVTQQKKRVLSRLPDDIISTLLNVV